MITQLTFAFSLIVGIVVGGDALERTRCAHHVLEHKVIVAGAATGFALGARFAGAGAAVAYLPR